MDLDSKTYSKLNDAHNSYRGSEEYIRILDVISPLSKRYAHETPEMWCSRIRDPFRKILKENPRILSGNGYISMYGMHSSCDAVYGLPSNYIYCSVCDSLVFIPKKYSTLDDSYRDSHLKRCISGNTISNECARKNEILESIDIRKFQIWQYKQYILQEEAKMKRLQLELLSQSTPHSGKDKLASVMYDYDGRSTSYETYEQVRMTMVENTMPSAPKFELAYISPARQEMVSPSSHQSSSDTDELFISSLYAKQPKGTTLRLRDGRVLTVV